MVQRDQMRKVHTAGVADLKTGRPIGVNNRMRIASTSKAFSGAVALSLVSKGALSLNDTIGEVLQKQPKAWREITLRQLLNHSSGTKPVAGRCGATRAVSRVTPSSWRPAPTAPTRWCQSTNNLCPIWEPPACSTLCAPLKGGSYAPR